MLKFYTVAARQCEIGRMPTKVEVHDGSFWPDRCSFPAAARSPEFETVVLVETNHDDHWDVRNCSGRVSFSSAELTRFWTVVRDAVNEFNERLVDAA